MKSTKPILSLLIITLICSFPGLFKACSDSQPGPPPNIIFAISDDQSFPHTGAAGCAFVNTPAFDRIANNGVMFMNGFVASPGCAPSRAAFLTGRYPWEIREAGNHAAFFPRDLTVFTDILEANGYMVGYTGKPWGPGRWDMTGWPHNPAGEEYSSIRYGNGSPDPRPAEAISSVNYAANFRDFLSKREAGKPFFFWYGAFEPHRAYEDGAGIKLGKDPSNVTVPGFLPDRPEIRSDLLDYAVEIEWYDRHLMEILAELEKIGELENTLIISTGDNGMPFPSAKANCYEYGIHVPLAISWPARVPAGRTVEDLVSFVDLAPTILEAAGIGVHDTLPFSGHSIMEILLSQEEGLLEPERDAVFSSRERHSCSRWNNLGYPMRAIRTHDYLYIKNIYPERWPAGAPQKYDSEGVLGAMHDAYHDIDACPSKTFLIENREDPGVRPYFEVAVAKRPGDELFDIRKDPACLNNLADDPQYGEVLKELEKALLARMKETGDPRAVGPDPDIFETHPRYNVMRSFPKPEWAE